MAVFQKTFPELNGPLHVQFAAGILAQGMLSTQQSKGGQHG